MSERTITELIKGVQDWARDKGIYEHSTAEKQWLYTQSEYGEICTEVLSGNVEKLAVEIGDYFVTCVNTDYLLHGNSDRFVEGWRTANILEPIDGEYFESAAQILDEIRKHSVIPDAVSYSYVKAVCAVFRLCHIYFLDPAECLALALDKISKRTGKIENGVFVKDKY